MSEEIRAAFHVGTPTFCFYDKNGRIEEIAELMLV